MRKIKILIFPVNFNIALSLDFNEGLNSGNYFKQIKKNITDQIEKSGLEKLIKIKDFSDIQKFQSVSHAEKFRSVSKVNMIIWGGFSNDDLKTDGEIINKIDLKFTFGYPRDEKNMIGQLLKLDFESKLAQKNYWQIIEKDSFKDVSIVSSNLFFVSTYIMAVILKLYGKIDKSLEILENLYKKLTDLDDKFRLSLIPHLNNCYELLSLESGLGKKNYPNAIKYCKNILKLNSKSFFAISNIAFFYYKDSKKSEAEEYVALLNKYYSDNPVTILNLAFFGIINKDYSIAYKKYCKLIAYKNINFNAVEVVDFLGFEYNNTKEPGLLFGSGIVSYYFGDKIMGINDLRRFIKTAKGRAYNAMRKKARKLSK